MCIYACIVIRRGKPILGCNFTTQAVKKICDESYFFIYKIETYLKFLSVYISNTMSEAIKQQGLKKNAEEEVVSDVEEEEVEAVSEAEEEEEEEEEVEEEEEEEEEEEVASEVEEEEEEVVAAAAASEAEEEEEEEEENASEDEEEGAPKLGKKAARSSKGVSTKKKVVVTGIEMLEATRNPTTINSAFEEESDEEPEEEEHYLQKFDGELRDNFILNYHPEACTHNYEEVKALARISRDGRGIIVDPLHKTLPFLTKYEMTRVLGQRAKQLDSGAKAFVRVPLNVMDGYHIAKLELEQKKIPFIIKRPFPNGGIEYWHVNDLEVL